MHSDIQCMCMVGTEQLESNTSPELQVLHAVNYYILVSLKTMQAEQKFD